MSIGYYNFGNVMAGNQQVVNSMAGLGEQISGAIENHAQTQAAQAMLPALQQSYQQGMQKIANGDPNGMSDIYSAASSASQIPMLQSFAQNAITTGQSANIHAQGAAKTQAYLQGQQMSSMVAHPEMYNSDGTLNTSKLGQPASAKPLTPYQQEQVEKTASSNKISQVNLYNSLYSGNGKDEVGIAGYADKINKGIKEGVNVAPEDLQNFAKRYSYYKQTQAGYGKNAIPNEDIEKAYDEVKNHLVTAQGDLESKIQAAKKKGEDPSKIPNPERHWYNAIWTDSSNDLTAQNSKLKETISNFDKINNIGKKESAGGLPSAKSQPVADQQQSQDSQMQQGNATFNSPNDVKSAFQAGKISQDQAVQLLQQFPNK